MKLSEGTIEVLKNFSTIRPTITIQPGKSLKTMSPSFGIRAFAEVEDEFPVACVIHDLPKFLNSISTDDNTELIWGKKSVQYKQSHGSVGNYPYSNWGSNGDPDKIKKGDVSNPMIKFQLPNDLLEKTIRQLGAMKASTIAFVGEKGLLGIAAVAVVKGVPLPNTYSTPLGDTDKKFRVFLDLDKLKIIPRDYEITIVEKKFVRFHAGNLDYYIAANMNSEFA